MEMIDVLKKLQEIAETKPELVKDAVESVEKTNPKEVKENAVESEAPIQEFRNVVTPRDEAHYRELMKQLQDVDLDPATRSDPAMKAEVQKRRLELKNWAEKNVKREGRVKDIHIGAQEYIGNYTRDDAPDTLKMPKADVLRAMDAEAKRSPFPQSYEIETAMKMVDEKFEDDGSPRDEVPEPDEVMTMDAPTEAETPMHDPQGDAVDHFIKTMGDLNLTSWNKEMELYFRSVLGEMPSEALYKAIDAYKAEALPFEGTKELNTNAMTKEDKKPVNESKKPVKEAITMSADTPEEAGMLMQIMKLAGVQQVTPDMIGAEGPAENDADHDHDGDGQQDHAPQDCDVCPGDDEVGSNAMGQMRDIVSKNDNGDQAEETFANEPEEKVSDVDTLVNVHSGGLNKQKQQVRKEYPGDNPLAVKEDTITVEDLANSFRAQYEDFKTAYQEAAKVTEKKAKPDFLDMDDKIVAAYIKHKEENVQEDAGEQALVNDLSLFFAKRAKELLQSMERPNTGDQEYEEFVAIAQAFKKGVQAGLDEVNMSDFEFSNNPFGDFGRGIDDGPDEELVDILNQHGYQPGPDGANDKATIVKQQEESVEEDEGDDLKRWYKRYSEFQGLNGDKLPFGWYMELVQTGVPTDSIEAGEARQAIADQNPELDPNDAESLAGSAEEIPGVDFDKADAPITNRMKSELATIMGVDAVGEEEITKAMKMLGVQTGTESATEDFLDMDKDGDKKEPMKKAISDKK